MASTRAGTRALCVAVGVATLLACCAPGASGVEDCGDWAFTCGNGDCLDVGARCDGRPDCADGSDETAATCNAGAVNIGLYDRATFTFAFDEDYGAVWILSCGDTSCSRVYVSGSSLAGALSYAAEINCTTQGFDCTPEASNTPADSDAFHTGEYVLVVERRDQRLAAWLRDSPDKPVTVSIDESQTQVRIRPDVWKNDMPVQVVVVPHSTEQPATLTPTESSPEAPSTLLDSTTEATSTLITELTPEVPSTQVTDPTPEAPSTRITDLTEATTPAARTSPIVTPAPTEKTSVETPTTTSESASSTSAPWPPVPAPASCTPELYLLIPVTGQCSQYVVCFSGRSQVMRCPSVLRFNYQLQTCDWPRNVLCSS